MPLPDRFYNFETTSVGLAKLEERIFISGSNSTIVVFEPTGLAWLLVVVYLKARHPESILVRVQAQKVVAPSELQASSPSQYI